MVSALGSSDAGSTRAANTRATGLNCPSCGAGITLATAGWSASVVCATCGAVLDAQDPNLRILQRQEQQVSVQPRIQLGTRGTWKGTQWDVVGFQRVSIDVEGVTYSWFEYVCFNPYRGFMYLTEYDGHWNVVEKLRRRPAVDAGTQASITFDGRTFKHFQSAAARTTFALGEFPWEVNVGDVVQSYDYVSPPFLLSAERSDNEVTWSLGTYTDPKLIARVFSVGGKLRSPVGVFANQPNPHIKAWQDIRRMLGVLVIALVVMFVVNEVSARRDDVFASQYQFRRAEGDTTAFVTAPFELKGRTSSVDFNIGTNLDNDWVYFNFALVNEESGQAYDVGRQVSYYYGQDSDGSWKEGSRNDHFRLGAVPSGRYILRVAPEGGEGAKPSVDYELRIRRDVPSFLFYGLALLALVVPAVFAWLPTVSFEQRRWAESDHAPVSSDDDE